MHKISTAIVYRQSAYPINSPFDASESYPEFSSNHLSNERNDVYNMVRQTLVDLEMDKKNIGSKDWSPFDEIITPGDTIIIKPNWITETKDPLIQNGTTSHPSVIRPIIDYCWKALKGNGKIIVGDCPGVGADFEELSKRTGLDNMIDSLQKRGVNVEHKDFRAIRVVTRNGVWIKEQRNTQMKGEEQIVDLGCDSLFADEKYLNAKLHGGDYDIRAINRFHKGKIHQYCVSKEILRADVIISVPKFKTHRKAGLTCCLKNLVGINVNKNYLPHFTMGAKNMGGDEMPEIPENRVRLMRCYNLFREFVIPYAWKVIGRPAAFILSMLYRKKNELPASAVAAEDSNVAEGSERQSKNEDLTRHFHASLSKQPVAGGAWAGNETICSMILDLNRIFLCCDKDGKLQDFTDRKIFYIADAVEIGVRNGPLNPIPVSCGIIAAGWNGFVMDTALLELFGIDHRVIPLYRIAEKLDWIHMDGSGTRLINGQPFSGAIESLPQLIPPDNWDYNPVDKEKTA
jgi:uncharacterized protein (DUF362 family)